MDVPPRARCCARAGVFVDGAAQRLLGAVVEQRWRSITTVDIETVAARLAKPPPSRRAFLGFLAAAAVAERGDACDRELVAMDAIRDAFETAAPMRAKRRGTAPSAISESTDAPSVFSRATDQISGSGMA